MRRFFVAPEELRKEEVTLTGDLLRHLGQVLRLSPGEEILLLDGAGTICRCRLLAVDRSMARARVAERWREEEQVLPIRLMQGLPKGDKLDLVLQKGTELGIAAFSPVITRRSVSRPAANRGLKRQQRWERIVMESARQSGRCRLPQVSPPLPLSEAVIECGEELRLLPWEEESRPLASVLPERKPRDVAILIGPEGGITGEEAEIARQAGFIPVALGPRILRTETAGLALAAILQYLYGDLAGDANTPGRKAPAGG